MGDLQFGAAAGRNDLEPMSKTLLTAVHEWEEPDICFISGDLTYRSMPEEFEQAGQWLSKLLASWPHTKLFIVPGNHDVTRSKAIPHRHTSSTLEEYRASRAGILASGHLENFSQWHQTMKSRLGERVLSDWLSPFGCTATVRSGDWALGIVGLNTALFSCGSDEQNLIQDVDALSSTDMENGHDFVIAIGHHPLSWLTPWNRPLVERSLGSDHRTDIYLHGHRHWQVPDVPTSTKGGFLSFAGGAAYSDARWPQFFSLNLIDVESDSIESRTFFYSKGSGQWVFEPGTSAVFPLRTASSDPDVPEDSEYPHAVQANAAYAQSGEHAAFETNSAYHYNAKLEFDSAREKIESIFDQCLAGGGLPNEQSIEYRVVLKGLLESISHLVGTVGDQLPLPPAPTSIVVEKSSGDVVNQTSKSIISIFSPVTALEKLNDLPVEIYAQAEKAVELWKIADASRQMGVHKIKYQAAAEAFGSLYTDEILSRLTKDQAKRLKEMASMERAYMLLCTRDVQDLMTAESIYLDAIKTSPKDPVRHQRLGQVYIERKKYSKAVSCLSTVLKLTQEDYDRASDNVDVEGDEARAVRMYESSQLSLALAKFREFQRLTSDAARRGALKVAIQTAFKVYQDGRSKNIRMQAVNDAVYYAWEERQLPEGTKFSSTLLPAQYENLAKQLEERLIKNEPPANFREADTLLRVFGTLGKIKQEAKWAEKICMLMERIAEERGHTVKQFADRFGDSWVTELIELMEHSDEKEALIYAQRTLILRKSGRRKAKN